MICKYVLYIHTVKWSNSSFSNISLKHKLFVCTQFKCLTVLSDAITPSHSRPEIDGNEEILRNPQSSGITGASLSDPSYIRILIGGGTYLSEVDWALEIESSRFWYWLEGLFSYICRLNTKTRSYNYLSTKNTIRTFVAVEMSYGLIFPRAKQCKTIHDEFTKTYLLTEQTS